MYNKKLLGGIILILIVIVVSIFTINFYKQNSNNQPVVVDTQSFIYKNSEYGFTLKLSKSWEGYTTSKTPITSPDKSKVYGYTVVIRNPKWSDSNPRMDIPIQVFTLEQWTKWESTDFEGYPTAAPMGPTERGRNSKYVFATGPRYNYSFATGWEEVDEIIKTLKGE